MKSFSVPQSFKEEAQYPFLLAFTVPIRWFGRITLSSFYNVSINTTLPFLTNPCFANSVFAKMANVVRGVAATESFIRGKQLYFRHHCFLLRWRFLILLTFMKWRQIYNLSQRNICLQMFKDLSDRVLNTNNPHKHIIEKCGLGLVAQQYASI